MILAVAVTTLQFGLLCKIIIFPRIIARAVVTSLGSLTHQPTIKFETFAVEKKSNANKHALKPNKNITKIHNGNSFCFGDDVQEKKQAGKPHERRQLDANEYIFLISASLNVVGEDLRVGLTVPA